MTRTPHARFWLSLTVALLLQLIELPDAVAPARPLWIPLVLVFWALIDPRLPALLAAFGTGILIDVIFNTPLGQHAAGFVALTWFMARLRGVFILFPLWQSTVVLGPAWAVYCLYMAVMDALSHHAADPWLRWLPVVSTTLFWPLVHSVLDAGRRKPSGSE